jgi:hypothetical protein
VAQQALTENPVRGPRSYKFDLTIYSFHLTSHYIERRPACELVCVINTHMVPSKKQKIIISVERIVRTVIASHHIRNNALRASSPALRTADDRVVVPAAAFLAPAGAPAAFALFAAAAARKRLEPLGRFTRVAVAALLPLLLSPPATISSPSPITPPHPRSRSTRRRNGLGRFSSSRKSYVGGGRSAQGIVSSEVTVRVPLEEEHDDDDEDDEDEEDDEVVAFVVVVVRSSSSSGVPVASTSTRLTCARDDTDGRWRRLVRCAGGAGAVREGTSTAVDWDCARVDAPTDLRFEGDLGADLARVSVDPEAAACITSGLRFEGDLVAPTSSWLPSSSTLSKSNIFANPRLWPTLGESTRISISLAGVGVARGSPVAVRTTPFIADAGGNAGGAIRSAADSSGRRVGRVGEVIFGRGVFCMSLVSCASGARMFFTSSKGVLSFFCPVRDVRAATEWH